MNNVHNTAEEVDGLRHDVPFLNPASNTNQVSRLRLINTSSASNDFTITAIDDAGVAGQEPVRITIAPMASVELSSIDLEQGASNTTGSFGDRAGKWHLEVESTEDARVMSLLEDPNGNLSNLSLPAVPDVDGNYVLNYMLPLDVDAQSFLRIINPNESATTVTVTGIDDSGSAAPGGDITIDLTANQTINFRSEFYEGGNESIGLQGSLGDGEGNWRLIISSTQNVTVMGLFRTPLGFLNVLHDNLTTVPATTHTASIFNPGSNPNQVSLLRLNNLENVSNTFTITGIDDDGDAADASVDQVVAPMESVMISSASLESDGLGDHDGKWQLNITSTGLSYTQSVLQAPDNFLSNLSTKLDVSDLAEGFFLDSPVANVDYRTATRSGSTDGTGRFSYNSSETVTFHIGDLDFPAASARRYVTPLTLANTDNPRDSRVVNMLRLLQTLDKDGNPDNRISISDTAKSNASQVDFDLSETDFENSSDVTDLVMNGGQDTPPTDLVSTNDAVAHFEDELREESVEANTIVGAWELTDWPVLIDEAESEYVYVIFFDDGTYYFAEEDEDTLQDFEYGTYTFRSGFITTTTTVDDVADIGLANDTHSVVLSGNTFKIPYDRGPGHYVFTRKDFSARGIVGAWSVDGETAMFVFLSDDTYIGFQWVEGNGFVGYEYGTYSYDGAILTTSTIDNNDGQALLCDEDEGINCTNVTNNFALDGDTLTLSNSDGDFTFSREL